MDAFASELGRKVADAAQSGVARRPATGPAPAAPVATQVAVSARTGAGRLVVIACSTGGPRALAELLPNLPSPLGAGVVIVQHMPPGFTASLAARLDGASALTVREARTGDVLDSGSLLVAPGGSHLRLSDDRRLRLADDAPEGGLKPRADFTIADAARLFGRRVLLVVLTGMGKDGLEGAVAVKAAGGRVLVEAESTCTVYGMPRAVAEAGLADAVLPLDQLADAIAKEL